MEYLAMAGFETNEIIASMPGVLNLAAAAQIDLGRSSDIVSNIMTGFGLSAQETDRAVDVLVQTMRSANTDLPQLGEAMKFVAPVAASLGLSIEETAAAVAKMSDAGIQGSQAGTSLRAALLALTNPVGQTEKAMDRLNIKVTDANDKMKPLPDLIGDIGEKLDGMTEAQKTATVAQLVGTEAASGFLALIGQGEDGLRDYTQSLENAAGAAEEVAKTQMDTLIGSFKEFQSALEEAGISVGDEFLPEFRQLVGIATGAIRAFGELDPAVVSTGLKMAGTAASVALVASTLGKLALAARGLFASMGPAGWLILGVSTLAAVVVGANDALERNRKVNLENAKALIEQEKKLSTNIDRFEELRRQNFLTNDELERFVDINSEISKTASPEKIEALKDEQNELLEKSSLTNEEMSEYLSLNNELIETVPQSTVKITDKGNALLGELSAAKELNQEQRERIRLELEMQLAKAEANQEANLRKEAALEEDIKEIEQNRLDIENEIREQKNLIAEKEAEINKEKAKGAEANEWLIGQNEQFIQQTDRYLQKLQNDLAIELDKLLAKQKQLDLTREELQKLDEIKQEMINIELAQAGLNGKKGDAVAIVDEELRKLRLQKRELELGTSAKDKQSQAYQETIRKIDQEIGKLKVAKSNVIEINGQLEKPINKRVTFSGDGLTEAQRIQRELARPVWKRLNISVSGASIQRAMRQAERAYAGINYHQGGSPNIDPRVKFHEGGAGSLLSSMPMHNEIDARLLRNEMVLTEAQQAKLFSILDSSQSTTQSTADFSRTNALLSSIERAIRESGGDTVFNINDREFARVTGEAMREYIDEQEDQEARAWGD
jgi:TP901 family phage tail tape measure protein